MWRRGHQREAMKWRQSVIRRQWRRRQSMAKAWHGARYKRAISGGGGSSSACEDRAGVEKKISIKYQPGGNVAKISASAAAASAISKW
jgi:ribosomal protein L44E